MEKRKLGNTGIEVPSICLGTMTWGQQNTEEQAHEQLDYAVNERGITFIDTAEIYPIPPTPETQGRTETYIGTWLAKRGKRDDLIIASKVASTQQQRNISSRNVTGLDRANIREAIEGSLKRLQTDYLDIYQVHSPDRPANYWGARGVSSLPEHDGTPIEETYDALVELIKEGKIRHIGVSNETPWGMMEWQRIALAKDYPAVVTIQNQYSLNNRTYEIGLSEISLRENIGLLAYSPLAGGALSGKYLGGAKPEGARFTISDRNRRYIAPEGDPAIEGYLAVAKKHGLDPSEMSLAFVTMQKFVTSTIIGATTMAQLKSDIDGCEMTLSAEVLADIEAVHRVHPDPIF